MGKKLTNEEFLQRLRELGRDDLEPLEEYKGRHKAIKFKCTNPDCQNEWLAQPGNIYEGQGCPVCALKNKNTKKYTKDTFNERLKELGRNDVVLIGEYVNSDTPSTFKCTNPECGHEWVTAPGNILFNGYTCPRCNYRRTGNRNNVTQKDFEEKVKELNPNVIKIGVYKGREEKVKLTCSEGHTWEIKPSEFYRYPDCPYCNENSRTLIEGFNDLATIRPELVKYFKDKELPKKLLVSSNKKVDLICPDCGYEKQMFVYNLTKQGFSCNACGDGVSYPNKILRNLLRDESIERQIEEKALEWNPGWGNKVYFDAKIVKDGQIYCIEMQGSQHKTGVWNGVVDEGVFIRDEYKREKCKENNIIEIEIDCVDTSFENIKTQLENSFSGILDFSEVNWDKIALTSEKSLMIKACEIYNNSLKTVRQIADELEVGRKCVRRYLERGADLGICIYSKEDSAMRGIFYNTKYTYDIYENDEFLGHFITVDLATKFLEEKFPGKKFYGNLVYVRAKQGYVIDGIKIVCKDITEQDKEEYLKEYQEKKHINLYNSQV